MVHYIGCYKLHPYIVHYLNDRSMKVIIWYQIIIVLDIGCISPCFTLYVVQIIFRFVCHVYIFLMITVEFFPPHRSQPCSCWIKGKGKTMLFMCSVRNHVRWKICSLCTVWDEMVSCLSSLSLLLLCDLLLIVWPSLTLVYFSQHGFRLFPLVSTVANFLVKVMHAIGVFDPQHTSGQV